MIMYVLLNHHLLDKGCSGVVGQIRFNAMIVAYVAADSQNDRLFKWLKSDAWKFLSRCSFFYDSGFRITNSERG